MCLPFKAHVAVYCYVIWEGGLGEGIAVSLTDRNGLATPLQIKPIFSYLFMVPHIYVCIGYIGRYP